MTDSEWNETVNLFRRLAEDTGDAYSRVVERAMQEMCDDAEHFRAQRDALRAACGNTLAACAAYMRVISEADLCGRSYIALLNMGVKQGFGEKAKAAIAAAKEAT